jgi:hypothetical protein
LWQSSGLENGAGAAHIRWMQTSIIKAILKEAGKPLRVQLYYVTVNDGEDPMVVFNEQDVTPDLVSAMEIDDLTQEEAAGFGFVAGEVRNVSDA